MSGPLALITGATGFIGTRLSPHLLAQGWRVRVLARRMPSGGWPERIETVSGGLEDSSAVEHSVHGADTVFHLAAKLHLSHVDASMRPEYERINVEGTRRLVEAAAAKNVRRFVYFSTINVYGACHKGEVMDETSALEPDSLYARTKLDGERFVKSATTANGAHLGVVLRLAAVYGQGMKGNYPRLVGALSKRSFIPIGKGVNRRTLVHVDDVVSAALLAAIHHDAAGKTYNVTDGQVHSMQDILGAICDAMGRLPPRVHVPLWAARGLAYSCEGVFKLAGRDAPLSRDMVNKYAEDLAVSGQAMQRELGYTPKFDLAAGWRDALGSSCHL